jgi:hypothetical protein
MMGIDEKDLLPNEKIIRQTKDGLLTLTTHRVRFDKHTVGLSSMVSITLDSVVSCSLVKKSHPLLILFGAILSAFGVYYVDTHKGKSGSPLGGPALLLFGIALILAFFITRKAHLKISSAGESILISAEGMKRDSITDTIKDIEKAKLEFISSNKNDLIKSAGQLQSA